MHDESYREVAMIFQHHGAQDHGAERAQDHGAEHHVMEVFFKLKGGGAERGC